MTSRNQLSVREWRVRGAATVVAGGLIAGLFAAPASAQQYQDNGRALDANPRSGSFGRNDAVGNRALRGPMVTGNQIVTGNVTAGRQFRDFTGYTDPSAFRGPTSGSFTSDRFIRDSAGVPRGVGAAQVDLARPSAFYGSQTATPPPVGYVSVGGGNVGYVPSSPAVVNPGLGGATFDLGLNSTMRPGELVLPSSGVGNQVMSASPLYGVRVWDVGQGPNDFLDSGVPGPEGTQRPFGQSGQGGQLPGQLPGQGTQSPGDRFRMDPNSVLRMREELNRVGNEQGQQDQGQGGAGQQGGLVQPLSSNALGGADATGASGGANAGGGGSGGGLQTQTLASDLRSNAIGGGTIATNQGIRYRLLVSPEKQTPQLLEMRRRFERQFGEGAVVGDLEANRQYNLERRAQQQPAEGRGGPNDRPGGPGGARRPGAVRGAGGGGAGAGGAGGGAGNVGPVPPVVPPSNDAGTAVPPAGEPVVPPPVAPAEPMPIKSLAADVQAKGLRDLLASAEDLMRQQKYAGALDKYQAAADVAPNNPLIILGRAHAELAAAYYRRAESDLRDALAQAPHLVQAQFDLKSLVGPERLQTIVKDLKDLAAADAQQARPLLLLAYIAYNTGNQDQAATYLDAAEKRVQGEDALLKAWRRYWKLPKGNGGAEPAPDANK